MTYQVQSSLEPQEWILENLGEEEVSRADDLFPTGLAWDAVVGGHDHEPHFVPHFPDRGTTARLGDSVLLTADVNGLPGPEDRDALASANRVFTFVNNTGQDANDLHIEFRQGVTPVLVNNSYGAFSNQSGGGSGKIDFDGGTVNER